MKFSERHRENAVDLWAKNNNPSAVNFNTQTTPQQACKDRSLSRNRSQIMIGSNELPQKRIEIAESGS